MERGRQMFEEGYTREHDARHGPAQLIDAALAYAVQAQDRISVAAGYGVGADGPETYCRGTGTRSRPRTTSYAAWPRLAHSWRRPTTRRCCGALRHDQGHVRQRPGAGLQRRPNQRQGWAQGAGE